MTETNRPNFGKFSLVFKKMRGFVIRTVNFVSGSPLTKLTVHIAHF